MNNSSNFPFDHTTLICFDVDGIFIQLEKIEYISGPIQPLDVLKLEQKGVYVTIVSPSPYFPKNSENDSLFEICNLEQENDRRYVNLEYSKKKYFEKFNKFPIHCIYISDNEDYEQAKKSGFVYLDVNDFENILTKYFNSIH